MKTGLVTLLITAGMLLASGVAAANTTLGTTNPGAHAAQVNGSLAPRSKGLHEVQFIAINGTNIQTRDVLWLQPGRYALTVRIIAEWPRNPLFRRTHEEPGYNTIELVVEAGKTYEVRAKYDRLQRRAPYSVILHRVIE